VKSEKDNSLVEFELIGIYSFFATNEDKNVDWYDYFQLKICENL